MSLALLLLFLLLASSLHADNLSFYNVTTQQGLSHNSVISIYQDRRGYMWFGTRDGLNMYDGNNVKCYKYDKDDAQSLSSNHIHDIIGGEKDDIYVATDKGVVLYNISQDNFKDLIAYEVDAICYYGHTLYYSMENKLYHLRNDVSTLVCELPVKTIIRSLCITDDTFYIGTQDGLYIWNSTDKEKCIIPDIHVFDIFKDSEGELWISSYDGKGLFVIDRNANIRKYTHIEGNPGSLSSNQTHRCIEDKQGNIWIGTFNGLNHFDKSTGTFTSYHHDNSHNGLSESSIWSLYCDRQGNIWAGTYYGGVNYFNQSRQLFHEYHFNIVESKGLSSSIVGQIIEDSHENLWICTEGGGVCSYDLNTRIFKWYVHDRYKNSISHNHAKCLYYDNKKDVIWIGTHMGGLNRLDVKTGRFDCYRSIPGDTTSLPSNIIMDIIPYQDKLILGTYRGVVLFNPSTRKCSDIIVPSVDSYAIDYIYKLSLDDENNLWIVYNSRRKIARYNLDNKQLDFVCHDDKDNTTISSEKIYNIYQDNSDEIWFCTNGAGVDLYDVSTGQFTNYDVKNSSLLSNVVYAIERMSGNNYVVTTDQGISILNKQTFSSVNFLRNRELPLSTINEYSLFRASTGEIFVGGMDGMISFDEGIYDSVSEDFDIIPASLWVNNKEIHVGDASGIVSTAFSDVSSITLGPEQNTFTLKYSITTYLPQSKTTALYKLEGASDVWMPLNENNSITFYDLPYGKYSLIVKVLHPNGANYKIHKMDIEVLPPFFLTIWAYILYTLLSGLIVFFIVKQYKHKIKLAEQIKYEQKHAEEVERMTLYKLRFFTNISHEFRTPLSIIIGYVEMILAKKEADAPLRASLRKVYRNCLQLNDLVTELLDFRKMEQGFTTIKVSCHDIVKYLYENYLLFDGYAKEHHIAYHFEKSHDEIPLWFDMRQMQKVVNNLLSNAFKNVPDNGDVTLSVSLQEDKVTIEVCNTGTGLTEEEIANVFNRFYQAENRKISHGTGIGLNLSKGIVELHHGTLGVRSMENGSIVFYIHLALGNEHFSADEVVESTEDVSDILVPQFSHPDMEETEDISACEEALPATSSADKKYSMLIVEDNPSLRTMLGDWFSMFYDVLLAEDGEEGLSKARQEMPDIIISDIVMPKMSGTEFCRQMKEDDKTCHIPIVLLTALTSDNYKIEGYQLGADDYVCKPFNMTLLLTRCNNLIKNRLSSKNISAEIRKTQENNVPVNNIQNQQFLDKARKIVIDNMDNPEFGTNLFAQEIGVSRTLLFMRFKNILNCTPNEYVIDIKMEHAEDLLINHPELNITQVSEKLGFSTVKQFRKYFKDKYQIAPLEYRNSKNS